MKIKRPVGKIAEFILSIPSWILRVVLLLLIVPVVLGGLEYCNGVDEQPSLSEAPWVVQTYLYTDGDRIPAHYYLGKEYGLVDGIPALKGYWEFDGKHYTYREAVIKFPKERYGAIDVLRRAQ